MDLVNAIAKARFGSARPQRVQLVKGEAMLLELLCLEPGQQLEVSSGQWAYYVVAGAATVTAGGKAQPLPTGHLAAFGLGEPHVLANQADQRLLCLAACTGRGRAERTTP